MRRKRVIRFLVGAFVAGGFVGLIAGLAFGGTDTQGLVVSPVVTDPVSTTASTQVGQDTEAKMTVELASAIGANEMGQVLVLSYGDIGTPDSDTTRSPDNFRKDLALLKSEGYYPINVSDLVAGDIDIPAGKSPVVITFDGSTQGQYGIMDDGSIDPDSAVGIMQAAVDAGGWASKATFFCVTDSSAIDQPLFGQQDKSQEKLHNLEEWGYEIGSHTASNANLKNASVDDVKRQLAQSENTLSELIGAAYSVSSLSLPFDAYPSNLNLLTNGTYNKIAYSYSAILSNGSAQTDSPFSTKFDPLHIVRVKVVGNALQQAIDYFKKHPDLKYISDGDPMTVSAPKSLNAQLGDMRTDLGRPIVRY
jgi:peptidoglycan/xylan/chitin deacetylase (PgdA/CDA1 family)